MVEVSKRTRKKNIILLIITTFIYIPLYIFINKNIAIIYSIFLISAIYLFVKLPSTKYKLFFRVFPLIIVLSIPLGDFLISEIDKYRTPKPEIEIFLNRAYLVNDVPSEFNDLYFQRLEFNNITNYDFAFRKEIKSIPSGRYYQGGFGVLVQPYTYTIFIKNEGKGDANNIEIIGDRLPSDIELDDKPTSNIEYNLGLSFQDINEKSFTLKISRLPAGKTALISFISNIYKNITLDCVGLTNGCHIQISDFQLLVLYEPKMPSLLKKMNIMIEYPFNLSKNILYKYNGIDKWEDIYLNGSKGASIKYY